MNFRDNITKIKKAAKSAKDTVVDFVSEEVLELDMESGGMPKTKRQLKEWVVTAGTLCFHIVAAVVTKGESNSIASSKSSNKRLKNPTITYPKPRKSRASSKKANNCCREIDLKDTSLDNLIRASSTLERVLEAKGGIGRGLHEKVCGVEGRIPSSSVSSIRFIASIRNQLVHEGPDTVTVETKRDYLSACERVLKEIKTSK